MNKLKGFIGICALTMMCSVAHAQIKIVIDNQEIPTSDIDSIVILPNSNLISVTTARPYTVQANDAPPPPPDAVAITSFSATSPIEVGSVTTINWATQNADSCTASSSVSAWNGAVNINGPMPNVAISTAGTYVLNLTCTGASGSVSDTTTVIVNEVTVPGPTTNCSAPTLAGTTYAWENIWGVNFPGPRYGNKDVNTGRTGYVGVEFNTGSVVDYGVFVSVGNTISDGIRKGAISECPGDFDVAPECDQNWGTGSGLGWTTTPKPGYCLLKPDTTYYFNVTFTDGSDPFSSTCVNSTHCIITLQHSNY